MLDESLKKLGYTTKRIDYGFIDPELLKEEAVQFETGDDHSPEHFRYRRFLSKLKSRPSLSGEDIDHYIELAEEDPDRAMAVSALGELARWLYLDQSACEMLSAHSAFQNVWLRRTLMRGKVARELRSSSLTPEGADFYIAAGDPEVQRALLDRWELSRDQLERLRDHGSNRAVRNMAKDKLRSGAKSASDQRP